MITGAISLSSGQQYFSNDIKKSRQKWLVRKSKFVWRTKNPLEHKYSVTFVSKVGTKTFGWNYVFNCSDFRYESNGIFVLGLGFFFLQTKFDFLTSHFWRKFFISFKRYCCSELKLEKVFPLWSFFVKLWRFKDCHFGHFDQFGTINARYNSRY